MPETEDPMDAHERVLLELRDRLSKSRVDPRTVNVTIQANSDIRFFVSDAMEAANLESMSGYEQWQVESRTLREVFVFRFSIHETPDREMDLYEFILEWGKDQCTLAGHSYDLPEQKTDLKQAIADMFLNIASNGVVNENGVRRTSYAELDWPKPSDAPPAAPPASDIFEFRHPSGAHFKITNLGVSVEHGTSSLRLEGGQMIISTQGVMKLEASVITLDGVVMINGRPPKL